MKNFLKAYVIVVGVIYALLNVLTEYKCISELENAKFNSEKTTKEEIARKAGTVGVTTTALIACGCKYLIGIIDEKM